VVRHIFGDHRPGPDKGETTDGHAANYGAVGPQAGPASDQSRPSLIYAPDGGAGVENIGEHHGWPAKDFVLQGYTFIDADVVLYFAAIPNCDVRINIDVLPYVAVRADDRATHDMAKRPNTGAVAYDSLRFNKGCGMNLNHKNSVVVGDDSIAG
jgi:hypothetical protein